MSQGSDSSQGILREIDECIEANNKLLEFSKRKETLILPNNMEPQQQFAQGISVPNPAFQQAVNLPLPPSPTPDFNQFWTYEEISILHEHKL